MLGSPGPAGTQVAEDPAAVLTRGAAAPDVLGCAGLAVSAGMILRVLVGVGADAEGGE